MTHTGMKVDLQVVEPDQFGNVLQHFTGSKAHNVELREAAVRRGLHVSEYGILDDATGETTAARPRRRSTRRSGSRGSRPSCARAAASSRRRAGRTRPAGPDHRGGHARRPALPHDALGRPPVPRADGRAARERGLEYLAITDHSASHGFGDHVMPEALRSRSRRSTRSTRARGLRGAGRLEVNILPDGSLDYDDELLAKLDWVVASVHTSFSMGGKEMTDRMIARDRAPAGRRHRPPDRPQDRDAPALRARHRARDRGGRADRHDDRDQRRARPPRPQRAPRARGGAGGRRRADQLRRPLGPNFDLLRYGIATARRAWLTPEQVPNTRPWVEFAPLRKRANG